MKVGILGSGQVGQMLARAFKSEGHDVTIGTRSPGKDEVIKFKQDNKDILVGSFEQTAIFGDVLILAVAGAVAPDVIASAGTKNFAGKIVIDPTNPIAQSPPENGVLKFFTSLEESLMERIQKQIPDAKVVKAFNSVGNTLMYKPVLKGGPPTMFICGNDEQAKKSVSDILYTFGWEVADMGKVEAARAIEPLCILWCIPGFLNNQWSHAFKLLKT